MYLCMDTRSVFLASILLISIFISCKSLERNRFGYCFYENRNSLRFCYDKKANQLAQSLHVTEIPKYVDTLDEFTNSSTGSLCKKYGSDYEIYAVKTAACERLVREILKKTLHKENYKKNYDETTIKRKINVIHSQDSDEKKEKAYQNFKELLHGKGFVHYILVPFLMPWNYAKNAFCKTYETGKNIWAAYDYAEASYACEKKMLYRRIPGVSGNLVENLGASLGVEPCLSCKELKNRLEKMNQLVSDENALSAARKVNYYYNKQKKIENKVLQLGRFLSKWGKEFMEIFKN